MACPLTTNYTPRDCKAPGGVKRFIITPFTNMLTFTVTAGVVTAITKTVTFKSYAQEPETANWKQTLASDQKMGSYGFDIEASFKTYGNDPLVNAELLVLTKNKLVMIAEEVDGTYTLLGSEYGMFVSADAFDAGTAFTDFKGDAITLKGRSVGKCPTVDPAIIAALLV
jgi:hypothetical protein